MDEARLQSEALHAALDFWDWVEQVQRAADDPDVHCLAALDRDELVATASLFVHGEIGYLAIAGTRESHRRRGAQGALIAARLERARELGLRWCVSETLYVLESSFNNLKRAGFEVLYEREMWTSQDARR